MPTPRRALLAALLLSAAPFAGSQAAASPVPSVDVYEDFLCPFCAAFDQQYGAELGKAASASRIKLRYHFVNKLDKFSASGDYSSRAAGAARCVANLVPGRLAAFRSRLFAPDVQPEEQGDSDLSNGDLARISVDVGAGAAASCVRQGAQVAAAKSEAATSLAKLKKAGGKGVPSLLKNGKLLDLGDRDWLTALTS
ncbi:DsbA family protein [Segniliparus rotundus]|uniref:DsbA family protein n=1 Tax=Segniliparus rotundus TaxID=286802 RepID=UPI000673DD3B|nr:thioredoxin domain-containing protein [Segniliparus rotundus]